MTDALTITTRLRPLVESEGGCACCGPAPAAFESATDLSGEQAGCIVTGS